MKSRIEGADPELVGVHLVIQVRDQVAKALAQVRAYRNSPDPVNRPGRFLFGGTAMGNGTALKLLSDEVCDRIAVVEEGLELEDRLLAFARDAGEALRAFDAEVSALGPDEHGVDRADVRCGLFVLHAVAERMLDSLGRVVCPTWDEETAA